MRAYPLSVALTGCGASWYAPTYICTDPEVQPAGSCPIGTEFIESFNECVDAVAALNLTGAPVEEFTSASNPHGCYFKVPTNEFWFNTAGDKSDQDKDRQSICRAYRSSLAAHPVPNSAITLHES